MSTSSPVTASVISYIQDMITYDLRAVTYVIMILVKELIYHV